MKLPGLHLRVASRIHLSFVIAAALPLFLLAATAYHLVTSRLEQVALEDARQLAKATGMDVFERLQFLTDQLHLIADYDNAARVSLEGLRDLDLGERIHGLFDVASTGVTSGHVALSLGEQRVIDDAVQQADGSRPLLLVTAAAGRQRLFLLVPDKSHAAYRFLGAELSLTHLWDTSGVAARPEYVCVLDEHQVPVFCNRDELAAWLAKAAPLVERRGRPIPLADGAGERVLTAVWSLFLKPHYQFERWTVVVGVPQSLAFDAIRTFDQVFAGVALVALLVAFLFGRRLIRSNLEPLDRLSEATGHLAAGEFGHRVELRSGDEFEQLGNAFNGMAAHIGEQFDTLETLAQLDRAMQLAKDVATAVAAAGDALDALMGPGRGAILCQERWHGTGRLWCRGLGQQRVVACTPPDDVSLQDRLDPQLARQLGVTTFDDLSVLPITETDQVAAAMVLRDAEGIDIDSARRIADVLGIALSNLGMEQHLIHQAKHDWLSGLPNRSHLQDRFTELTANGAASTSVGMLLIGLDRFKQVNDSLGHAGGDRLLAEIGRRLRAALPAEVLLGRLGGDQFVLLLSDADPSRLRELQAELARRVSAELDRPYDFGVRSARFSATMGAALYPSDATTFEGMLQCLDAAGFAAKASRRGGLLFFSAGMRDQLAGRMEIEQALKGAVENDELELYYQPVVDSQTLQVRSAEALMRWHRPGVGLMMPAQFIDVAEQSGLIGELGRWAIGEACRQMRSWQAAGVPLDTLNVNVASVQLADDAFERTVADALYDSGLDPACLTLEVTESALIERLDDGVERLKRLRALGVGIMIDDFGTGYASLKYLKMLPVDGLKIDRLFVKDLPDSPTDEAIIAAVVSLVCASGFKLVAEGVETEGQASALRSAGVPLLQGFLFARGLPADQFGRFAAGLPQQARRAGGVGG